MKLVWHAEALVERDWLRYLLGDVVDTEVNDPLLTCIEDETIHVVSTNWEVLTTYSDYFQKLRAQTKHIVLIHVSDEWFAGGYAQYQYFDLVIRWNHTYLADAPGVVTVPLGYPNNTGQSQRPADQRRYAWSFVGQLKSSRYAMIKALGGLEPCLVTRTGTVKRITKADFDAVLEDSVFAPCPMGNATIETTRVYESLEFGCIPLLELRPTIDYYTNLLGRHPLPAFRSWTEARQYAQRAYGDKPFLLEKQAEVVEWWQTYKAKLCAQVQDAIRAPSQSAELHRFAARPRNQYVLVHEPLRILEIVRHQTAASLLRRLARPIGPLTRVLADLSGGKLSTPDVIRQNRERRRNH